MGSPSSQIEHHSVACSGAQYKSIPSLSTCNHHQIHNGKNSFTFYVFHQNWCLKPRGKLSDLAAWQADGLPSWFSQKYLNIKLKSDTWLWFKSYWVECQKKLTTLHNAWLISYILFSELDLSQLVRNFDLEIKTGSIYLDFFFLIQALKN